MTLQYCIRSVEIGELNLQAPTHHLENIAAPCNVFASGADLPVFLNTQPYAKPKFMWPQNWHDRKHPDAMINDFRSFLDNTQEAMHPLAMYSGLLEFIKHQSHNSTYISDEQLHPIELYIFHGIKNQVDGSEGERVSHMCRCTGSHSWHGETDRTTGCAKAMSGEVI